MAVALKCFSVWLWRLRKAVFLLVLAVLCYGLFRHEPPPELFKNSDKFLHALAFLGFSLSARIAFINWPAWILWPLLFTTAVGSEWLQTHLQPFRHFSVADITANLLGVALAAMFWLFVFSCQRWYCTKVKAP